MDGSLIGSDYEAKNNEYQNGSWLDAAQYVLALLRCYLDIYLYDCLLIWSDRRMSTNMKPTKPIVIAEHDSMQPTNRSYVIGFGLSVTLTLIAYFTVKHHSLSHFSLVSIVVSLAILQFGVQMIFFLHLGHETKPRWKLLVLGLMLLVVAILVFGSLWIMNNLNYNMMHMTPQQTYQYMHNNEGI